MQHLGLSLWKGSGPEGSSREPSRRPGLGLVEEDVAPALDGLCVPLSPVPSAPCDCLYSDPGPVGPPSARWVRTGEPPGLQVETWLASRPGQARPGCVLQGWRPQVMCSLCGGEGSIGTCLTLTQPVSQAPWTLLSLVEGLWPLPCVAGHGMCSPERRDGRCQPGGCWGPGLRQLWEGAYSPAPDVAAVPAVLRVAPEPLVLPCALGSPLYPLPVLSSGG